MGLINLRDLLAFPSNGDNATDTIINGIHFNTTALKYWNYTLYTNNTLSNVSNCFLVFGDYAPTLLSNGTFVNGTTCYVPILPLHTRGRLGATFGAVFGISIMFTLINLKKHGQLFLREDKRFKIIGRRWPWYWMLFVGGCGMISCITGIDVDRDYLQDLALILQSLFFYCMGQAAVACVWESVRHWASWQERQIVDRDPYALPVDDTRGKVEFYMPLVFYFFAFMSFFMIVPRSWTKIPHQGGLVQQTTVAKPLATDARFKAGGLALLIAWSLILYYTQHSISHYGRHMVRSSSRGPIAAALRFFPIRFVIGIALVAVHIGYVVLSSFRFDFSIMKYDVSVVWPFALGYAPCALLLVVYNVWGFMGMNEDRVLIKQRQARGRSADAEMGVTKKPSWWSKAKGDTHLEDAIRARGYRPDDGGASDRVKRKSDGVGGDVEMESMPSPTTDAASSTATGTMATEDLRSRSHSRSRLSPVRNSETELGRSSSSNSLASALTGHTLTGENVQARQQVVRSMLDV